MRHPSQWESSGILGVYLDARKFYGSADALARQFVAHAVTNRNRMDDWAVCCTLSNAAQLERAAFEDWYDAVYLFEYGGK